MSNPAVVCTKSKPRVELAGLARDREPLAPEAGEREVAIVVVLQRDHDVEQRRARRIAGGRHGVDHPIERQEHVRLRADAHVAHALEELHEGLAPETAQRSATVLT